MARFYDPYIAHFTSADTIVPGAGSAKAFNRYAYTLYNPIRYNDPSGHRACDDNSDICEPYTQADQKNDLKLIIKAQFNWNIKGNDWTVKQLETIYQVGNDISNVVGGDYYLRGLLGEVDFDLKKMRYGGLASAHHVWLNSRGFDSWTVAHELGHSLDANYGWNLSKKLEEFTGGHTRGGPISFGGPACLDTTAPGCNKALYFYGGVPPKGADWNFNRKEDFAESFAALVYPDQAKNAVQSNAVFRANPALLYDDYLSTSRGMWMSAIVYLLGR